MKKKFQVAIDSPAASGAGTQAQLICKYYNFFYLDTGKLYRILGKLYLENNKKINYTLFKKKITTDAVNYSETKKIIRQNRNKLWGARRNVGRIRKEISAFPIVPLIIPIPIDIN